MDAHSRDMPGSLPHVFISREDLVTIDSIVKGYLAYLRKGFPASSEHDQQIQVLQQLQQRFANILVPKEPIEDIGLLLLDVEVDALDSALLGFMRVLPRFAPPSPARDEAIHGVQDIRRKLTTCFSSPSG